MAHRFPSLAHPHLAGRHQTFYGWQFLSNHRSMPRAGQFQDPSAVHQSLVWTAQVALATVYSAAPSHSFLSSSSERMLSFPRLNCFRLNRPPASPKRCHNSRRHLTLRKSRSSLLLRWSEFARWFSEPHLRQRNWQNIDCKFPDFCPA